MLDRLRRNEKAVLAFVCAVGLIPAFYFASWVHRYGVAVPKLDDWDVAMLISKAHHGQLSWGDLFAQQEEGRTVLPRILFLISTIRGCWDVRDLMALTIVTCALTALGVFVLLRKTGLSMIATAIGFWLSALLIFSPAQFPVITFAFGLPSFLPAFFIVAALVVICSEMSLRSKFIVSVLLAVANSFTLPHGLLAWGITFPVLFLQRRVDHSPRWLAAWLSAAVCCAALYFWGYRKPVQLPEFAPAIPSLEYVRFVLSFLGNGMEQATKAHLATAEIFGTLTLTIYLCAVAYVVGKRSERTLLRKSAPWFALGLYSIGSACLAALGRVGFGRSAALSPRYLPFSLYLTIAAIVLAGIIGSEIVASGTFRLRAATFSLAFTAIVIGLIFHARCVADGVYFLRANAAQDRLGRGALMFSEVLDTSAVIQHTIYPPSAEPIRQLAPILDAQGLLRPPLVRNRQIDSSAQRAADGKIAAGAWELTAPADPDIYRASGWAALIAKGHPADCVVLAYEARPDQWIAVAMSDSVTSRPDVSGKQRLNDKEQIWSGWTASFPRSAMIAGEKLSAWAVDTEGPVFYRLDGQTAAVRP